MNSRFESNNASGAHATVCLTNMSGAIVDNCVFKDNTVQGSTDSSAKRGAGALYLRDSRDVVVTNCKFTHNVVNGEFDGGAIYVYDKASVKEIINCSFDNNVAPGNGGAFYTALALSNTLFKGCNFTSNTAGVNGGAVYLYANSNDINFENCRFDGNKASNSGSAIYADQSINGLNVVGSTFTNNRITGTPSNLNEGGGALHIVSGNDILVDGSTFTNNNAYCSGGAIFIVEPTSGTNGNFNIKRSSFNRNTATTSDANKVANGGAIYIPANGNPTAHIDYCNFTSNGAANDGAAVWWGTQYDFNTTDCIFTGNTAGSHGGAVWLNRGVSNIEFNDCAFTDNTATNSEGGNIFLYWR